MFEQLLVTLKTCLIGQIKVFDAPGVEMLQNAILSSVPSISKDVLAWMFSDNIHKHRVSHRYEPVHVQSERAYACILEHNIDMCMASLQYGSIHAFSKKHIV